MLKELVKKYAEETNNKVLNISSFETPVGNVIAAADDSHLYLVSFEDSKNLNKQIHSLHKELSCYFKENRKNKVLQQLQEEMAEYFDGKLKTFTVPLKTIGSDFQKEVWNMLQEMPYSSTQTYGELAKSMGRSASHARAIGAACGANNHLLLIPCHRLVASTSNGGFSCGLNRKEWLLEHEKKHST